jgi:hypothetical protein
MKLCHAAPVYQLVMQAVQLLAGQLIMQFPPSNASWPCMLCSPRIPADHAGHADPSMPVGHAYHATPSVPAGHAGKEAG